MYSTEQWRLSIGSYHWINCRRLDLFVRRKKKMITMKRKREAVQWTRSGGIEYHSSVARSRLIDDRENARDARPCCMTMERWSHGAAAQLMTRMKRARGSWRDLLERSGVVSSLSLLRENDILNAPRTDGRTDRATRFSVHALRSRYEMRASFD